MSALGWRIFLLHERFSKARKNGMHHYHQFIITITIIIIVDYGEV